MKPDISIVIPAFNESERLGGPLRKVLAYLAEHQANGEVIVVDDGSSDDTAAGRESGVCTNSLPSPLKL